MSDFDYLTTVQLINLLKSKHNCTEYRAAKMLGISTAQMSRLMSGKSLMGDETAVKLAKLLGYNPAVVVFSVMRERAARSNNADMVEIIESLPPEYLKVGALAAVVIALPLLTNFHSIFA